MTVHNYLPRVVDNELRERLARIGAVVVEGPKGCGKTETAVQQCASAVRLDTDETARVTAEIAPANILEGPTPRLIDEWQLVPSLWNAVRKAVDDRRTPGQFILTGSATPVDDPNRHTGTGRMSRLRMRTLSLSESCLSSDQVSLAQLMSGAGEVAGSSNLSLNDLIEETCHGGWPADRELPWALAQANVADYCTEVANADIRLVDGVRRNTARVRQLMQSLARATDTQTRRTKLAADAANPPLGEYAVATYLDALEKIAVLEPLPSWSPTLRARARIRVAPKHYFVDPAMSAALINMGPDQLKQDLKTYGSLFKSLVLRDLRVYAQSSGATIHHYLDSTGLAIDAIVDGGYGRWGAIAIRLGSVPYQLDKAAADLKILSLKVDTEEAGDPKFLAIITASGYAYTRPDGVSVIPLATLHP
ncbi:MAG: DUF4143 domain-containing protein [Propionibacteriaceae bacterium]|jgi:predicted AAA+ superfamily ATPase|nr:DUF4143 domain-containing protein [Propionibacteriaceae bacterium]